MQITPNSMNKIYCIVYDRVSLLRQYANESIHYPIRRLKNLYVSTMPCRAVKRIQYVSVCVFLFPIQTAELYIFLLLILTV